MPKPLNPGNSDFQRVLARIIHCTAGHETARAIAAMYHDGQGSKSYRFVSTGYISDSAQPPNVWAKDAWDIWKEMFSFLTPDQTDDVTAATWMANYLLDRVLANPRPGSIPDWSDLWV